MTLETSNSSNMEERNERRKRKRWGAKPDATSTPTSTAATATVATDIDPKARILAMQENIRARLAAAKASTTTTTTTATLVQPPPPQLQQQQHQEANALKPVKRAKLYELDLTVTAPTFQDDAHRSTTTSLVPSSASHTNSDGNIADATKAVSTKASAPVRATNPYLAHLQSSSSKIEYNETGNDDVDDEWIDERLHRTSKVRKRHKELTFVEPGKWQEIADTKRAKELKAVASGYLSGRKAGHTIHAPTLASSSVSASHPSSSSALDKQVSLAPRADAHPDTKMPLVMEWWDIELLPFKLKKLVAAYESGKGLVSPLDSTSSTVAAAAAAAETTEDTSNAAMTLDNTNESRADATTLLDHTNLERLRAQCWEQASLSHSKTSALVQHICPIQPPNAMTAPPPKQAVLRLTKKEMKRQRKLRRQEKQRETQDLQAAGLIPAPEPRLTLRNFIQVLGDQAFLDPSQIERKVQEQMQARQQAHLERNAANKLTNEQRAAKRARLYTEDTSLSVTTAVFYVKDMSHPYHRTKVDLNAQQLSLSGCVLECFEDPSFACIIVEGGPKAIKRFSRLMLVRMKWTKLESSTYEDDDDDDVEDDDMETDDNALVTRKFNPDNMCAFVWQGMVVKRLFHGFLFQACETHDQARKILKAKGALHYWEQVVVKHTAGRQGMKFQLKIAPPQEYSEDSTGNLSNGVVDSTMDNS